MQHGLIYSPSFLRGEARTERDWVEIEKIMVRLAWVKKGKPFSLTNGSGSRGCRMKVGGFIGMGLGMGMEGVKKKHERRSRFIEDLQKMEI